MLTIINPLLLIALILYEHFNGDPDEASENGVTGQSNPDPASDPATHLPVELVVTPLSNIDTDANIYKSVATPAAAQALALARTAASSAPTAAARTRVRSGRTRRDATSST